jgi:hypothetical protein
MEPNGTVNEEIEKLSRASRTSLQSPQRGVRYAKATRILDACRWKDTEILRALATSEGGLVSDEVRRQACTCHKENLMHSD